MQSYLRMSSRLKTAKTGMLKPRLFVLKFCFFIPFTADVKLSKKFKIKVNRV